jgi:hypothetical protein
VTTTGPASDSAGWRAATRSSLLTPLGFVSCACLAVVVVRVTYVVQPLRFDESGYLMVARQWHGEGPFLYGDYWVDRPPVLMLIFRVASLFEADGVIRLLAVPFALLFILAAARVGWLLGGVTPARLATLVSAALVATPATGADQASGELFAASLVMVAITVLLEAHYRDSTRARFGLALVAGVLGAAAPLVKQSFVEALVFGAVIFAVAGWHRYDHRPGMAMIATGALLGASLPLAAVLIWTYAAPFDLAALAYTLVGFRADALGAVLDRQSSAAVRRVLVLAVLAIMSGIVPILLYVGRAGWRRRRSASPVGWATAAIACLGVLSIVAGGSYWPDYLLQLAPATVLGTALMAAAPGGRRALEWVCVAAACSAVVGSTGMAAFYLTSPSGWWPQRTGEWLRESSTAEDTAVVMYGAAAVQHHSGLRSPYPYLWSLPVRVLDPDVDRLEATLGGPEAPDWIVQRSGFDSQSVDQDQGLRTQVQASYRIVAVVCGNPVWLRRDLTRDLAGLPNC